MKFIHILFVLSFFFFIPNYLFSEETDTLRLYRLGTLDIYGYKDKEVKKSILTTIPFHEIQRFDVSSVSEMQVTLPSSRIRTNSRGESMLFLRGAGERQLGLFFDGVPMNLPWDNRLDLSFVPSDLIGNIDINMNAGSIMFGPNILGGLVNISTFERGSEGFGASIKLQGSTGPEYSASITHDGMIGKFNYITNFSYLNTESEILSANAPDTLLHQDSTSNHRLNSDKKRINVYARGEFKFDNTTLGMSVSLINGSKGVHPETHLPIESARFWRYPEWERLILTLNGEKVFVNDKFVLTGTIWIDNFSQTIDAYDSPEFIRLTQKQNDKDFTLGSRLAIRYRVDMHHSLAAVFNGFISNHEERIDSNPVDIFSQQTFSTGLQYIGEFEKINFVVGAAYDAHSTPKTGQFSEAEGTNLNDYAYFANMNYTLAKNLTLFANISRRTRFPTMREAFSGALNRFKVNPDLKSESGLLNEIGLNLSSRDFRVKLSGFMNFYDRLIVQKRLSLSEDSLRRRIRMNIAEATITGFETLVRYYPITKLAIIANFTYLNTSGRQEGKEIKHLDNKPEILSGIAVNYSLPYNFSIQTEMEMTGTQYETDPINTNDFIQIHTSAIFNARISYKFPYFNGILSEIYIRANNIFDKYHLYQLGLPEPGRTLYLGINASI